MEQQDITLMEYQGRSLVSIREIIGRSKVLNVLEKMLRKGESLLIDKQPAIYEFPKMHGPGFEKFYVYGVKNREDTPRFITSVDRLFRGNGKTLRYKIS